VPRAGDQRDHPLACAVYQGKAPSLTNRRSRSVWVSPLRQGDHRRRSPQRKLYNVKPPGCLATMPHQQCVDRLESDLHYQILAERSEAMGAKPNRQCAGHNETRLRHDKPQPRG